MHIASPHAMHQRDPFQFHFAHWYGHRDPRPHETLRPVTRAVSVPQSCWINMTTGYTWSGARTASGTWPAPGTIAGPIAMRGQRLSVAGYGEGTVLDTGGAMVQQFDLDLFFGSQSQAVAWGVRFVRVCRLP